MQHPEKHIFFLQEATEVAEGRSGAEQLFQVSLTTDEHG
jgi:hypothetical protein